MSHIEENIANNIVKLRKSNKMTQQDLAEKLNYSDKAISKWERGDSVPDIEMLCKISEIFKVDVNFLTKEHNEAEINKLDHNSNIFIRNLLILILLCVAIFFLSTIAYILAILKNHENAKVFWLSYIYALPLCSLISYFCAKKANIWLMRLITISTFVWTTFLSVYLTALEIGYPSLWLLFIVAIPIQAAICLFAFWKKTF